VTASLVVVGVDLSLTSTGIATAGGVRTIASSGRDGASLRVRHARLADVTTRVVLAVSDAAAPRTALVVIEGPAYAAKGGKTHERAGLWWMVVDELLSAGHLVAEVPPPTLKKYALGKGVGDKGAMVDAAARRMPQVETRGQNDAVDALWLRAMGMHRYGQPLCSVPKAHAAALDAVAWPDVDRLDAMRGAVA
jgi:Holliday junction resolvasome RuvABC endonuclease subunit